MWYLIYLSKHSQHFFFLTDNIFAAPSLLYNLPQSLQRKRVGRGEDDLFSYNLLDAFNSISTKYDPVS